MPISATYAAVIPCLNEAPTIGPLVAEIKQQISNVIVVDDGSTDGTACEARRAGADVLRREIAGGKGSALRHGFRHATHRGFAWALTMDGDGQHSPADIPKFFERADAVIGTQMIVGNRMASARSMPWVRRCVNQWMSARLSALCGAELPDSQCGFRLVNLASWSRFEFAADHFEVESELLVRFLAAGLKVEFVPIETRYGAERSKIHPLRDTIRWLGWWRQIRDELPGRQSRTILFSKSPDVSRAAVE